MGLPLLNRTPGIEHCRKSPHRFRAKAYQLAEACCETLRQSSVRPRIIALLVETQLSSIVTLRSHER